MPNTINPSNNEFENVQILVATNISTVLSVFSNMFCISILKMSEAITTFICCLSILSGTLVLLKVINHFSFQGKTERNIKELEKILINQVQLTEKIKKENNINNREFIENKINNNSNTREKNDLYLVEISNILDKILKVKYPGFDAYLYLLVTLANSYRKNKYSWEELDLVTKKIY